MTGVTSLPDQAFDIDGGDYRNAGDVVTVPSPLPYIFAEEKHADRQAREALFCTFNADLGFFERAVLGVTQATGARVTVVGDLRMSNPDPRAARNAGSRYVHGLAVPPTAGRAFHPKLTVIVGPARALVAVGSGNLSVGRWHLNAETWTIAAADRDRCPWLVVDAAEWLRSVARLCAISPPAADAMGRTAAALEALSGGQVVDTGHRLVHTSDDPIIDQLPATPVECLRLYAPFHDERAEAIQELLLRLTPARVTLALQSGHRTVLQPEAIARVIDDLGIDLEVVEDRHRSYRDGKLVEAIGDDGVCWTLTGSPNLSSAALLKSVADGGNVELGVLAQPSASLFPGGVPIRLDEVPAVRISATNHVDKATAAALLAATRAADGLHVTFARPTPCPVRVVASAHTDFDTWVDVGAVPEGAVQHLIAGVDLPGGSRVRTVWTEHGVTRDGNLVFVTDTRTFLANLDHPDRGPDRLRPGSHDRCRWHCPCCGSTEWVTTVSARIQRQGCGGCRGMRTGRRSVIASKDEGPQFDELLLFRGEARPPPHPATTPCRPARQQSAAPDQSTPVSCRDWGSKMGADTCTERC
ncbi:zinc-ribbon domain-containing protein [Micromonospora echinaurantiaca]|uniref:zinc-ribbon domain-containing protein n=1 Tax=Micromonospora echinaurantiaca TaxID=47857 RepID=UPI0037910C54